MHTLATVLGAILYTIGAALAVVGLVAGVVMVGVEISKRLGRREK